MREPLTQARLRALLHYEPVTGNFTRRIATGTSHVGDIAGSPDRNGHIRISLEGRLHSAHRLAWLFMTGHWPDQVIDHIDGQRANNRWQNLRDVSMSVNQQNQTRAHSRNQTGLLGVTFNKRLKTFQAQIGTKEAHKYLGLFDTANAAHEAYLHAKRQLHEGGML